MMAYEEHPRAVDRLARRVDMCAEHGRYLRKVQGTAVHDDGSVCVVHMASPGDSEAYDVGYVDGRKSVKPQANLGLASTKELLEELQTRFAVTTPAIGALDAVVSMLEHLRPETLAYRSVDHG